MILVSRYTKKNENIAPTLKKLTHKQTLSK